MLDPVAVCHQFEEVAALLCELLERGSLERTELRDRLTKTAAAAELLPDVEPSETRYPEPVDLAARSRSVANRVGEALLYSAYEEVLLENGELALVDLSLDLSEVFEDLQRGLAIIGTNPVDAVWELRFGYESHWGAHLRRALRVLT